ALQDDILIPGGKVLTAGSNRRFSHECSFYWDELRLPIMTGERLHHGVVRHRSLTGCSREKPDVVPASTQFHFACRDKFM
ncbi:MAG: hypothetical protein WB555_21970, partial [Candidatus Korobacteraceae bacterium]